MRSWSDWFVHRADARKREQNRPCGFFAADYDAARMDTYARHTELQRIAAERRRAGSSRLDEAIYEHLPIATLARIYVRSDGVTDLLGDDE